MLAPEALAAAQRVAQYGAQQAMLAARAVRLPDIPGRNAPATGIPSVTRIEPLAPGVPASPVGADAQSGAP